MNNQELLELAAKASGIDLQHKVLFVQQQKLEG